MSSDHFYTVLLIRCNKKQPIFNIKYNVSTGTAKAGKYNHKSELTDVMLDTAKFLKIYSEALVKLST